MVYRDFDTAFSRRALLRGGALLGAGAALSGAPALFAQDKAAASNAMRAMWPSVAAMVDKYVDERKVANMVATLGWGQRARWPSGRASAPISIRSIASIR